jgi:hypothetical protein
MSRLTALKESAEERRRFFRDAGDLVRCLTIEFEIELGFGSAVVPIGKTFEFGPPERLFRERGASDGDAHAWRLPRNPVFFAIVSAEVTTPLAMRPDPPSFSLAKRKMVSPLAMCLPPYIVFCALIIAAGAHCYVIAPRKLDEECSRVKTDPRDATTLCQRLSRYLEGNTRELAVIRVPSQQEEQARHVSRQREQFVHHRQKLEAQGRSLLISHALPAPAHWWKEQTFSRLDRHLPAWVTTRLQTARPALLSLQEQIEALTSQLEASAESILPRGVGKLTSVMLTREICDWHRFNNRRAISSYTGLCPGERTSGSKGALPAAVSAGAKAFGRPGKRFARPGSRA